jgi:hypothetical protein
VQLGIGLLYPDFEEVRRKPGVANATPVKTKAKKDVKREQWSAKTTVGVAEVIEAASRPSAKASVSQIKETHSALNYFHWLRHHPVRLDQYFPRLLRLICTVPRPSQGLLSPGSQKRKGFEDHEQAQSVARAALLRLSFGRECPSAFLWMPSECLPERKAKDFVDTACKVVPTLSS